MSLQIDDFPLDEMPRLATSLISCLRCRVTVALPYWDDGEMPREPERCPFCKMAMRFDPNRKGGGW